MFKKSLRNSINLIFIVICLTVFSKAKRNNYHGLTYFPKYSSYFALDRANCRPSPFQLEINDDKTKNKEESNLTNPGLFAKHITNSGNYLIKVAKASSIVPHKSLNMINETDEMTVGVIALAVGIPLEITTKKAFGSLSSLYYYGKAANNFINSSQYLSSPHSQSMNKVGLNLKKYRNYSILGNILVIGGLGAATYSWINSLDLVNPNPGNENPELMTIGLSSILLGRLINLFPLVNLKKAGRNLNNTSNAFSQEEYQKLMYKSGMNLRSSVKTTYWGYGFQGAGLVIMGLGIVNDNSSQYGWGLATNFLSWVIFEGIAASSINYAGEKLVELGRSIVR